MKDKKYYTPSIEEFHVGFEFQDKNYPENDNAWTGRPYTLRAEYELDTVQDRIDKNQIRVKHLDQSDIESLGWEYVSHDNANTDRWHDVHKKGDYQMISGGVNKGLVIKKVIIQPYDHTLEVNLFQGTIKNKSELKTLLKWLKIN